MSNIKNEIRMLLLYNEVTMTKLVELLNDKYARNDSVQNLNNKLSKETIRYSEVLEIANVLGYRLAWIPELIKIEAGKGIFFGSSPTKIKHKQKGKQQGFTKIIPKEDSLFNQHKQKKEPSDD